MNLLEYKIRRSKSEIGTNIISKKIDIYHGYVIYLINNRWRSGNEVK
jgi:hypothetical protein